MTKKTEVATVDQTTGEIVASGLPADMLAQMEQEAQTHHQHFDQDQLIIPRITILQPLSPQVQQGADHIEGARPGMIFNTVTGDIMTALTIIPAHYAVRFTAWRPRLNGGGLINGDVDRKILTEENGWVQENPGKWLGRMVPKPGEDPIKVEVIMAGEWAAIARNDAGGLLPVAISFAGSKARIGKKINSKIELTEVEGKNGFFVPPPYFHWFSLTTGTEKAPDGTDYWNYVSNHLGFCSDARARDKAKKLREAILAGEAQMSDVAEGEQA